MKNETIEIIGAFIVIAGAATMLALINRRRKKALLRNMYFYSNVPHFIEHQLNRTHKRFGVKAN